MKVALLMCLLGGVAAADPTPDDEKLYDTGVAAAEAHDVSAAIAAFSQLESQYPNSKLAPRATARLGRLYGDVAMYDKAADKLEEYAKKYAGEKDAYDALSDAVYFRKALGDREKAVVDTRLFIKLFGAKQKQAAADALFSLSALFEDDPARALTYLREYVRTFGNSGGADKLVIAHGRIGQLLWKQSCPVPMTDGLCVTASETKRSCGTGTAHLLEPRKRNEAKVKDAVGEFIATAKALETSNIADPAARYFYAQAKLAEADLELETYLAIKFPRALDLASTDRETSRKNQKRFNEWLTSTVKIAQNLTAKYEAVLAIKDTASSITAAERLGVITEAFASAVVTGEIPRNVRGPDATKAYCSALTDVASPLEQRSEQAFAVCLAKSTELAWFGESSRQCELALARHVPEDFPLPTELHAEPRQTSPVIALEPQPAF